MEDLRDHRPDMALDEFKKADKQDDGRCFACQRQMIKYGVQLGDWKTAELACEEMVANAKTGQDQALAHYQFANVLFNEALQKHKQELFSRAHEEIGKALSAHSNFPDAYFLDGKALANLNQDDAAKTAFETYIKLRPDNSPDHQRALRYVARPELARARMAPPFSIAALDGRNISLDDTQGKVVLLDFWATWCPPCREAVPHLRKVAQKFQGEPLIIISASLDSDEAKWKEFLAKNEIDLVTISRRRFYGFPFKALWRHRYPAHVYHRRGRGPSG